jgi:hypothetical protein
VVLGGAWFRFGTTARGMCGGGIQRVSGPGGASGVRLSKIDDYLADKFCVLMLSEMMGGFKGKVVGPRS